MSFLPERCKLDSIVAFVPKNVDLGLNALNRIKKKVIAGAYPILKRNFLLKVNVFVDTVIICVMPDHTYMCPLLYHIVLESALS